MPHVHMEYSANLAAEADIGALCELICKAMAGAGLFEVGGIRVRAFCAQDYAIADRDPRNAFLDISVRIGAGRSLEDKKKLGEIIHGLMMAELAHLFATPHFALSLEVREIDPDLSWKTNSMHARLRNTENK